MTRHVTRDLSDYPPLMTTAEVASLMRVTPAAATTGRHRGQAPYSFGFRSGRKVLYRREDVLGWIAEQAGEAIR